VKELEYLVIHEQLKIPYTEDFGTWEIEITHKNKQAIIAYSQGSNTIEKQLLIRD